MNKFNLSAEWGNEEGCPKTSEIWERIEEGDVCASNGFITHSEKECTGCDERHSRYDGIKYGDNRIRDYIGWYLIWLKIYNQEVFGNIEESFDAKTPNPNGEF